jgi:hypothetical protein
MNDRDFKTLIVQITNEVDRRESRIEEESRNYDQKIENMKMEKDRVMEQRTRELSDSLEYLEVIVNLVSKKKSIKNWTKEEVDFE